MKNMPMRLIGALALVLMVAFNSCKEDDGVITPQFPELKEVTCEVNDELDITFNANLDWSIQSSAAWCKFVNGEFAETTASGKAGEQTLKIRVSDESWNYQTEDVAELTLKMMDATQVIYKITRGKKEYQDLVVVDSEGNKVGESFIIKGNTGSVTYSSLKASAEKGVKVGVKYPEWLIMTYNSASGYYDFTFNTDKETNGGLDFREPYDGGQSFITFVTEDAETAETDKIRMVMIPVSYEGFDKETVLIEPKYMNIKVSYDGKVTVDEQEQTKLTSKITAFENDFEVVVGTQTTEEVNGEKIFVYDFSKAVNWVKVTSEENSSEINIEFTENIATGNDDSGDGTSTYSESATSTVGPRSAIAFVLPKKIYDEAKSDFNAYILDETTGDIKSSLNTFILFTAEQDAIVEAEDEISFICRAVDTGEGLTSFIDASMGNLVSEKIEDTELLAEIKSQYTGLTTTNMWSITLSADYAGFIESMPFIFEAVGRGTGQIIYSLSQSVSTVTCSEDKLQGQISDTSGYVDVYGVAISGTITDYYDIALKNEDGTIASFCRIKKVK